MPRGAPLARSRRRSRRLGALLGAILASAGCGGVEHDATRKQLDELRAELSRLRADQAAIAERLEAIDLARGTYRGGKSAGRADADRPQLDVVRLAPDEPTEDEADDALRPVLRSAGSGAVVLDHAKGGGSGDAQQEYDRALALHRIKSWDKAIEAFSSFLARFPEHDNADNATFWRAESYAGKLDLEKATTELEAVVARWPQGNKAPDALLRLVSTYTRLGKTERADQARKRLLDDYATSDAAKKLRSTTKKP